MALIDRVAVKILVETKLLTANAAAVQLVLMAGTPVPANVDRWCKLLAIDLDPLGTSPRHGGGTDDGADFAAITITVQCFASAKAMKSSTGSLASVMAAVRAAMAGQCLRDVGTTHQVDLDRCREIEDREIDENRGIATGAVIFTGLVTRTSGNTMTPIV
jgi:hypothetical protein